MGWLTNTRSQLLYRHRDAPNRFKLTRIGFGKRLERIVPAQAADVVLDHDNGLTVAEAAPLVSWESIVRHWIRY